MTQPVSSPATRAQKKNEPEPEASPAEVAHAATQAVVRARRVKGLGHNQPTDDPDIKDAHARAHNLALNARDMHAGHATRYLDMADKLKAQGQGPRDEPDDDSSDDADSSDKARLSHTPYFHHLDKAHEHATTAAEMDRLVKYHDTHSTDAKRDEPEQKAATPNWSTSPDLQAKQAKRNPEGIRAMSQRAIGHSIAFKNGTGGKLSHGTLAKMHGDVARSITTAVDRHAAKQQERGEPIDRRAMLKMTARRDLHDRVSAAHLKQAAHERNSAQHDPEPNGGHYPNLARDSQRLGENLAAIRLMILAESYS